MNDFTLTTLTQEPGLATAMQVVYQYFHGFLRENFGSAVVGEDVDEFLRCLPALPTDTAAWVLGELQ